MRIGLYWPLRLKKLKSIHGGQIQSDYKNHKFGRLQLKTEWRLGCLEVTMASKLLLTFFGLNSLTQLQWQTQIWPLSSSEAKKRSVFAVFMAMMTI